MNTELLEAMEDSGEGKGYQQGDVLLEAIEQSL